jgi:hypothetical protein
MYFFSIKRLALDQINPLTQSPVHTLPYGPAEERMIEVYGGYLPDHMPRNLITEASDAETVYGIRTNYNAVNEYCNLLIKYILDHGPEEYRVEMVNKNKVLPLEELNLLRLELEIENNNDTYFAMKLSDQYQKVDIIPIKVFSNLEEEILVNIFP